MLEQTFDCNLNIFNYINDNSENAVELKFSNGKLLLKDQTFNFIKSTFLFELATTLDLDATFVLSTHHGEHNRIHIDLSIDLGSFEEDELLREILNVCTDKYKLNLHNLEVL